MELFEINSIIPAVDLPGYSFIFGENNADSLGLKYISLRCDASGKSTPLINYVSLKINRNNELEAFHSSARNLFNFNESEDQLFLRAVTRLKMRDATKQELIKNIKDLAGKIIVPAGGGLIEMPEGYYLIIEPLGNKWYLVACRNFAEVVQAKMVEIDTGKKPKKTTPTWFLSLFGEEFKFDYPVTDKTPWKTPPPSLDFVKKYAEGKHPAKSTAEMYRLVKRYIEDFGDYEEPHHVPLLTISVFQTYLIDILTSVFQTPISGEFGSGKTSILEMLASIGYHGLLSSTVSPAARVRIMQRHRISWYGDELDRADGKTDENGDNLNLVLLRVGYRRGNQYIRWNMDTDQPDILDPFSCLTYTYSSDMETALKTRSLGEFTVSKSDDYMLPVINSKREQYAQAISNELFLWRVEFFRNYKRCDDSDDCDDSDGILGDMVKLDKADFRKAVYGTLTGNLKEKNQLLLTHLFGRDNELAYVACNIGSIIGIDITNELVESLNFKRQSEIEGEDELFLLFVNLLQGQCEAGQREVKFSALSPSIRDDCKNKNVKEPKTSVFRSWYRKLGIKAGKNLKHSRDGSIIVLDDAVKAKIEQYTTINLIDKIQEGQTKASTLIPNIPSQSSQSSQSSQVGDDLAELKTSIETGLAESKKEEAV